MALQGLEAQDSPGEGNIWEKVMDSSLGFRTVSSARGRESPWDSRDSSFPQCARTGP